MGSLRCWKKKKRERVFVCNNMFVKVLDERVYFEREECA